MPQRAAEDDETLALVRSSCVKVLGTPDGDDWRLSLDEATAMTAAYRTWPDGKVGTEPEAYTSDQLRQVCAAWLDAFADDPMEDAPGRRRPALRRPR